MKTTLVTLIAAASALVMALPASAQEATPDYPTAYTSNVSRDEVRATAIAARAAGQIVDGERSFVATPIGMPVSRATVVAELREARRLGLVADGEQVAVATESQLQSIKSAGLRASDTAVAAKR
jgi:hypothetical protein